MVEWSGSGLQIRAQGFDSPSGLHPPCARPENCSYGYRRLPSDKNRKGEEMTSFRIHLVGSGHGSARGLSGTGHDQAQAVGQRLARHLQAMPGFQRIRTRMLVAPTILARETAGGMDDGLIRGGFDYERRECTQLRDRSFRMYDGTGPDKPFEPDEFRGMMPYETDPQICDRLHVVFDSIHRSARREDPVTDTIVVAGHDVLRCFIDEWLHTPWTEREEDTRINLCSIQRIERGENGRWSATETYEGFPAKVI